MHDGTHPVATARLRIDASAYALQAAHDGAWAGIAVLPGGAGALLPTRALDEPGLERAIEVAEDWLMPHATRLRGVILEVSDPTGRLQAGLREVLSVQALEWSVADIEGFFLRLVGLTTGRAPSAAVQERWPFVADVLMLRELAHHGQVRQVRLANT